MSKRNSYWQVTRKQAPQRRGPYEEGSFGIFANLDNIWTVFTTEHLDFLHKVIAPFIRGYRPLFSRVYLSSRDMRKVFEELEQSAGAGILAKKAISYSHRKESEISYKRKPYWQIFEAAETEDEYVDKVEFIVDKKFGLHGFLSRDGVCKFFSGEQESLKRLLTAVANVGFHRRSFFAEKVRPARSEKVYPIDLSFSEDVFRKPEDNFSFLAALCRLPRSGIAVMHQNPYVHVSLVDFYDGSSFDIFATRRNAVIVIPQVSSSPFALNRLCNHIFEEFHEGKIGEPVPATYTIKDFTS